MLKRNNLKYFIFGIILIIKCNLTIGQTTMSYEDLVNLIFANVSNPFAAPTEPTTITGGGGGTSVNPSIDGHIGGGGTGIGGGSGTGVSTGTGGGQESSTCSAGSECVPLYLCKDNFIITNGETLIDIRFDNDKPLPCNSLEECCAFENKVSEPITRPEPAPEGCGFRNVDGVGFKITGDRENEAQYGEFPWMVAILKEDRVDNQIFNIYQCGGSLIHPSVVLTAAHCVDKKPANILKVRAGEYDTQTKAELYPDQDRNVVDVVMHEDYYRGALYNDIALLFVDEPFQLEENVRPICLPPPNMKSDGLRCFATGWGKDIFGREGKYQVILKKIDLPIVPRDQCQKSLRTTRLGSRFELHPSFLCAGGEVGKDTCKGDGGSPLICPIAGVPNRYYQAGIVAWGIGCGDEIPGIYADVAKLRGWIDEKLAYKKIQSSSFTP